VRRQSQRAVMPREMAVKYSSAAGCGDPSHILFQKLALEPGHSRVGNETASTKLWYSIHHVAGLRVKGQSLCDTVDTLRL
jgi:hypothetical protein